MSDATERIAEALERIATVAERLHPLGRGPNDMNCNKCGRYITTGGTYNDADRAGAYEGHLAECKGPNPDWPLFRAVEPPL